MSINDYNNNHGSTIISPFKEDMLADNNVLAKIPYKGNPFAFNVEDSCCRYIKREYFGPVNLNRFDINSEQFFTVSTKTSPNKPFLEQIDALAIDGANELENK